MLRITEARGDDALTRLHIEGRVTAQTADALQASCAAALAGCEMVLLDLSGVRYVDAAGVLVLRALTSRGAVLIGCSALLDEMLKEERS